MTVRPLLLTLLLAAPAFGAGRMSLKEMNDGREEIRLLTLERIRAVPEDSRAIVTGESRLRELFEEYQVQGGTPPVRLSADTSYLRGESQKLIRLRSAGRTPPADPGVAAHIEKRWNLYLAQRDALKDAAAADQQAGKSESTVYWATLRAFDRLLENTDKKLLHNTPPGERSLTDAFARDRAAILMSLESGPKKTRVPVKVVVPEIHAPSMTMDVSAFYHAVDSLPEARPLTKGAWTIPVRARTVTERRAGVRLVVRPAAGQGLAYIGSETVDFQYGYLVIPAETAYYFENTGTIPLDIEFVGIKP